MGNQGHHLQHDCRRRVYQRLHRPQGAQRSRQDQVQLLRWAACTHTRWYTRGCGRPHAHAVAHRCNSLSRSGTTTCCRFSTTSASLRLCGHRSRRLSRYQATCVCVCARARVCVCVWEFSSTSAHDTLVSTLSMSTLHCIFRLCSTLTAPPPALHARTCAMSPLQHCGSWFWQLAVDFAGAGAGRRARARTSRKRAAWGTQVRQPHRADKLVDHRSHASASVWGISHRGGSVGVAMY